MCNSCRRTVSTFARRAEIPKGEQRHAIRYGKGTCWAKVAAAGMGQAKELHDQFESKARVSGGSDGPGRGCCGRLRHAEVGQRDLAEWHGRLKCCRRGVALGTLGLPIV